MLFSTVFFIHGHLAELKTPAWSGTALDWIFHVMLTSLLACAFIFFLFVFCFVALTSKSVSLRRARLADEDFLAAFHYSEHPLALLQNGESHDLAPLDLIYQAGSRQTVTQMTGITDFSNSDYVMRLRAAGKIMPSQMQSVRASMEDAVMESRAMLETKLGGLSAVLRTLPWLACLSPLLAWMEFVFTTHNTDAVMTSEIKIAAIAPVMLALAGTVFSQLWLQLLMLKLRARCTAMKSLVLELSNIFDHAYVNHADPMDKLPSIGSFSGADVPSFSLPPTDAIPRAVTRV